jgi:hypothetical protein
LISGRFNDGIAHYWFNGDGLWDRLDYRRLGSLDCRDRFWSRLGRCCRNQGDFGRLLLRRRLLGRYRCLLLGGFGLLRLLFLGLYFSNQALALGLSTNAVCLGIDDARRMTLRSDSERVTEVKGLSIAEPQLSSEFVDAYLCCQWVVSVL